MNLFSLIFIITTISFCFSSGERPIFCYFPRWSVYREGDGKFTPDQIDPFLCTHLVYGFFGIDGLNFSIQSKDAWADFTDQRGRGLGNIERLVKLKAINPNLKVIASVGGWSEGSVNFSVMADSSSKRNIFIKSVLDFLRDCNFDGLDISWEYPTDRGGIPEDRSNLVTLLKELKAKFEPFGYILSVHLSGKKNVIDSSYDIRGISSHADYLTVATYQYNGPWEKLTGINSPLRDNTVYNVEFTINYLLQKGALPRKLLLGLPTYGHTFLANENFIDGKYFRVPANETFTSQWTDQPGFVGFHEMCWNLTRTTDWTEMWDEGSSTPFAISGLCIASYDNKKSFEEKLKFLDEKQLGGAMLFSLDTDDFRGLCYGVNYPLLRHINDHFHSSPGPTLQEPEVNYFPPQDPEPEVEHGGIVEEPQVEHGVGHGGTAEEPPVEHEETPAAPEDPASEVTVANYDFGK